MKTYLDCFPCFLDQALRAARIATDDPVKIKAVLDAVALMLPRISLDSPPPEIGRFIYGTVHKITNNRDPLRPESKKRARKRRWPSILI